MVSGWCGCHCPLSGLYEGFLNSLKTFTQKLASVMFAEMMGNRQYSKLLIPKSHKNLKRSTVVFVISIFYAFWSTLQWRVTGMSASCLCWMLWNVESSCTMQHHSYYFISWWASETVHSILWCFVGKEMAFDIFLTNPFLCQCYI